MFVVMIRQTGLSHACASGFMPILELLSTVADDVDPNLADNDGNTPLIFAAQAGKSVRPSVCLSVCLSVCVSVASIQIYFEGGIFTITGRGTKPEAREPVEFLGRGQRAPSPPTRWSGERCKLPQGVRAEPRKI